MIEQQSLTEQKDPYLKRPFDICLSILGLVVFSPLWVIVSLTIHSEDRGPVFFSLELPGRFDKPFSLLKFRTMKHPRGGKHEMLFLENDPRVTKLGRILRATALDELPQLMNILRGDMSFVGPRPVHRSEGNPRYEDISEVPGYETRRKVRPGLTGLAQLYADKYVPARNKFRYDALYVKNMGFLLDLRIILLSLWITLKAGWERRGKKA